MTRKGVATPPLRSIACVVVAPILLWSVAVSSLVFIPSSPATTSSMFVSSSAAFRRATTTTTPSTEHPKSLWSQRRLSTNHGWAAVAIGRQAVRRNFFSTTALVVVRDEFHLAATVAAPAPAMVDFDIDSSASEWRRVAGFQHQQIDEAMEIARIQRQARAVTHKHEPIVGGGGGNIQLKKQLVTSIFSTPAVAHRRRNRSEPQLSIDEPTYLPVVPTQVPASTTRDREEPTSDAHTAPLGSESDASTSSANPSFHQPPVATVVKDSTQSETAISAVPEPLASVRSVAIGTAVATDDDEDTPFRSKTVVAAVAVPVTVTAAADDAPGAPTLGAAVEKTPVRGASISQTKRLGTASTAVTKKPLSDRVRRLRSQPKSAMVESILQARYAAISDVGLRAYQILCDLEMVVPTPNRHDDPNYDTSRDDEPAPENRYIR